MKNNTPLTLSFLLILIAYGFQGISQEYEPLVQDSSTWTIFQGGEEDQNQFYALQINGDTTINDKLYKKLYFHELQHSDNISPFSILNSYFIGALRENIQEKKVYGIISPTFPFLPYDCIDSTYLEMEYLIVDFNVSIGDTLDHCSIDKTEPMVIEKIEMDFYMGKERKVFLDQKNEVLMAEGIGFYDGILADVSPFVSAGGIYNELFSFCKGSLFSCNIFTGNKDISKPNEVNIFPNPMQDVLNIQTSKAYETMTIYSHDGRIVYNQKYEPEIRIEGLYPGIYFLELQSKSLEKEIFKMVKN